jgi:hypothetical protein
MLDEAGYPKTPQQRRAAVPGRSPAEPVAAAAPKQDAATSASPNTAYPRN